MKRVIALALLLMVALASSASARWVEEPLHWVRSNSTDGLYFKSFVTTGAAAKVDTLEAFSLNNAEFPPFPLKISATAQDTTVLAKVVVYGDSTVASTISFTSSAFALQANAGSQRTGWQDVYTYTSKNTDGQKYVEIPIWSNRAATITRDLYIDRTGDLSLFGNQLRIIATLTGATAVPTMKAKLVYWVND